MVGHHHTCSGIDGNNLQILIEADFLVNLYEDNSSEKSIKTAGEKIFRAKTGKELKKCFHCEYY